MIETKIYIGLNDADTLKQEFETEKYIGVLKHVCNNYHVPFTFTLAQGGCFHENGSYTQENTLVLTFLDIDPWLEGEIARDLCLIFNQESVMVTQAEVTTKYISEKL